MTSSIQSSRTLTGDVARFRAWGYVFWDHLTLDSLGVPWQDEYDPPRQQWLQGPCDDAEFTFWDKAWSDQVAIRARKLIVDQERERDRLTPRKVFNDALDKFMEDHGLVEKQQEKEEEVFPTLEEQLLAVPPMKTPLSEELWREFGSVPFKIHLEPLNWDELYMRL